MSKQLVYFFILSLSLILGLAGTSKAQNWCELQPDTFLNWVMEHHPLSIQADLIEEHGALTEGAARGNFDPYFKGDFDSKTLKETPYYDRLYGGFSIPTWYGVDLSVGFDRGLGSFVNPENITESGGLWKAGIAVPLGKGLLIDKRRATLRDAQLTRNQRSAEREAIRLELMLEAGKTYWKWYVAEANFEIAREAEQLAIIRKEAVVREVQLGSRAAVDSIEAGLFVQDRTILRLSAEQERQLMRNELNLFLWLDGLVPLEIDSCLAPPLDDTLPAISELPLINPPLEHPLVEQASIKLDKLKLKQRLNREALRPEFNLSYDFLIPGNSSLEFSGEALGTNNLVGVTASMPLFLRAERGQIRLTENEMQRQEIALNQKYWQISITLNQLRQNVLLSAERVGETRSLVASSEALLTAEQQKFSAGESSLFLVNSREQKMIESRQKLVKAVKDNRITALKFRFYSNSQ